MMEIVINKKKFSELLKLAEDFSVEYLGSKISAFKWIGKQFGEIYSFMDRICWALEEGEEISFKLEEG